MFVIVLLYVYQGCRKNLFFVFFNFYHVTTTTIIPWIFINSLMRLKITGKAFLYDHDANATVMTKSINAVNSKIIKAKKCQIWVRSNLG